MIFVDLETCFLRKGFKRKHQQILEIGMCRGKETFQCLVNPCGADISPRALKDLGQHPEKSINFWTSLLIGKGLLPKNNGNRTTEQKAKAIQDVAGDMLSPMDAIKKAHAFGAGTWVAHNGKSFDFHILRAHMDKAKLEHPTFVDSLPVLRKELDLVSYSQPLVYKALFKDKYKAHHALHDARALQRIWNHVKSERSERSERSEHREASRSELLDLHGVGPKSVQELNKQGIYTIRELARAAKEGKTFKVVRKSVLAKLRATPEIQYYTSLI